MPPFDFAQSRPFAGGRKSKRLNTIWIVQGPSHHWTALFFAGTDPAQRGYTVLVPAGALSSVGSFECRGLCTGGQWCGSTMFLGIDTQSHLQYHGSSIA